MTNTAFFLVKFFLVAFGAFRIAFEVSAHFGLFDIFHRMRGYFQQLAIDHPDKNILFLDEIGRCATCISMIVSIPLVWLAFRGETFANLILIYLAVNGVVVWIHFKLLG
mgnify:CR=1 FL=1